MGVGQAPTGNSGNGRVTVEGVAHIGVRHGGEHRCPTGQGQGIQRRVGSFKMLKETWTIAELIAGETVAGIVDSMFVAPHTREHARPAGRAVRDRMRYYA